MSNQIIHIILDSDGNSNKWVGTVHEPGHSNCSFATKPGSRIQAVRDAVRWIVENRPGITYDIEDARVKQEEEAQVQGWEFV